MKKLVLATLCGIASAQTFSAEASEDRMQFLESQLKQIQAELEQQKAAQLALKNQQEEAKAQDSKTLSSMVDNVDVYGLIRLDGAIDFKSTTKDRGRTINQINKDLVDSGSVRSDFTAAASRIGFLAKDLGGNPNVSARLEADFWTGNGKGDGGLRVRHAHLKYYNWTFGQAWSLMSTPEISTEAVDYSLLLGGSVLRTPQVSYAFKLDPENTWNVGLEYMAGGDRSSALPALTTKYVHQSGPLHVLAQGFVNQKQAQTDTAGDIDKVGWGVGLGGRYRFDDQNSIQGNYFHMVGDQRIAAFLIQGSTADGSALGGDYSVDPTNNELLLNEFNSLNIGFTHKFTPKLRSSINASIVDFDDSSDYARANPATNKRLTDYVANVIYSPVPNINLGAEYHQGKRETFDNQEADVSRVNLSATYSF
ncbi:MULTISPECIES: DcaP family trimeric outer membrane transporter [unclassified Acinetobacter]|uniref:DcaP family trimeric outer membrane transporter n=1 Tax=unclassified Acinetobacter TaxID=196816 RepID=UPI0015D13309|nr:MULTISPECIES: DcaP family trimeric outer membrane transporter [unclassified Acinetobacter]